MARRNKLNSDGSSSHFIYSSWVLRFTLIPALIFIFPFSPRNTNYSGAVVTTRLVLVGSRVRSKISSLFLNSNMIYDIQNSFWRWHHVDVHFYFLCFGHSYYFHFQGEVRLELEVQVQFLSGVLPCVYR
jgi:hypothetical protein